jgi:hypothetical protein
VTAAAAAAALLGDENGLVVCCLVAVGLCLARHEVVGQKDVGASGAVDCASRT